MTRRDLPPIFARVRFGIAKADQPPVIACVSGDMIREARESIDTLPRDEDVPLELWSHCWLETPSLGMLCFTVSGERSVVLAWNMRDRNPVRYSFEGFGQGGLDDLGIIVKGQFYQAAYALHLYTQRAADVSVNTLTRNGPRFWKRQGDTLRFARVESLASAAGQSRQRDYERPQEPSGIRMREHGVRGHWRTYASGVRVWVRPHTRGDATLGRVTRMIG